MTDDQVTIRRLENDVDAPVAVCRAGLAAVAAMRDKVVSVESGEYEVWDDCDWTDELEEAYQALSVVVTLEKKMAVKVAEKAASQIILPNKKEGLIHG